MSTATSDSNPLVDSFPHIPVANTLGIWLIAVAVVFLLNGLLFHQTYRYFREYSDDRTLLKVWVAIVVILQTFVSALVFHTTWVYSIHSYWDRTYLFLGKVVWSINILPTISSITAISSQLFFIRRLCLLAPNFKPIAAIVFVLNVANLGCFIALSVKMFVSPSLVSLTGSTLTTNDKWAYFASIATGVQMAGDIILTVALFHVFRKSRTGLTKTDSMLEVMIAYAIGTGAVNCVGHVITIALSVAYPHNWVYGLFACIDIKLYAIGFLVALDSRKFLAMTRCATEVIDPDALPGWNLESTSTGIPRAGVQMSSLGTSAPTALEFKVLTRGVSEDEELRSKRGPVGVY
ncbi:hypothetical protein GSI_03506 [Ganoderma sinense ZZ0214-1]|uniref:DUF6534 domain-containing protein n=1 Tax=Ganoderma sinense ZZ0214-1 TaxID=1077348 RepID=A0A2G8SLS4_9APHY|nr:hypothetical protein GSI_03506 [Ganoderma sinense ZZ0214-1]